MDKVAGEFREQCKARQKHIALQRKKRTERQKTAAEIIAEELIKEAGLVNHASKVVNGAKRTGQLLTGSHARKLKKNLTNLQNSPSGNLKESLTIGNKMMSTKRELGKELGKVTATRAGVTGAGLIGATSINKNKSQGVDGLNV